MDDIDHFFSLVVIEAIFQKHVVDNGQPDTYLERNLFLDVFADIAHGKDPVRKSYVWPVGGTSWLS